MISTEELLRIDGQSQRIKGIIDTGKTAVVYKLEIGGQYFALKKCRERFENIFHHEVQIRSKIEEIKTQNPVLSQYIVDTIYACSEKGIILSQWVEGNEISHFNESIFERIFDALLEIDKAGLFDFDLHKSNILVDGSGFVKLIDLGGMYSYNPLTEYNNYGFTYPTYHFVERFETRFFLRSLLLEEYNGISRSSVLLKYRIEKEKALKCYNLKREWLSERGADSQVVKWIEGFLTQWSQALKSGTKLYELYARELFRSCIIDLPHSINGGHLDKAIIKINEILRILNEDYDCIFTKENICSDFCNANKREYLLEKYSKILDRIYMQQDRERYYD
ncbi:MAG: hypothetical protein FWE22_00795 [Firmicutes bacterium]|nr:hypothetical protein [Bacillota bacterium]